MTIDITKNSSMAVINQFHNVEIKGYDSSVYVLSEFNTAFYFLSASSSALWRKGMLFFKKFKISFIITSEKERITNINYICTFIIDFPIAVAVKKVVNGIKKWPQVIPAKSNKGLGIDAHNSTVMNACFYKLLYISYFNFATVPSS